MKFAPANVVEGRVGRGGEERMGEPNLAVLDCDHAGREGRFEHAGGRHQLGTRVRERRGGREGVARLAGQGGDPATDEGLQRRGQTVFTA